MSAKSRTKTKPNPPPSAPVKPRGPAVPREPHIPPAADVLMSRDQVARALGISTRTLDELVSAGQYPRADFKLGLFPRWTIGTHLAWVEARTTAKG